MYDAVDLYQWVCARYFVGVKGAETKASAVKLSAEFQKGLRKPCPAQKQSGANHPNTKIYLIFSIGYDGGGGRGTGIEPSPRSPE
jgi:hypothetical protein